MCAGRSVQQQRTTSPSAVFSQIFFAELASRSLKNIGLASCDAAEDLKGALQCLSDVITIFIDSRYAEIFDLKTDYFQASQMCAPFSKLSELEGGPLHRTVLEHVDADASPLFAMPPDTRRFEAFVYVFESQLRSRLHELVLPYFYQACYAMPAQGTTQDRASLTANLV